MLSKSSIQKPIAWTINLDNYNSISSFPFSKYLSSHAIVRYASSCRAQLLID